LKASVFFFLDWMFGGQEGGGFEFCEGLGGAFFCSVSGLERYLSGGGGVGWWGGGVGFLVFVRMFFREVLVGF